LPQALSRSWFLKTLVGFLLLIAQSNLWRLKLILTVVKLKFTESFFFWCYHPVCLADTFFSEQPPATSQQYFSLRTNEHQPSALAKRTGCDIFSVYKQHTGNRRNFFTLIWTLLYSVWKPLPRALLICWDVGSIVDEYPLIAMFLSLENAPVKKFSSHKFQQQPVTSIFFPLIWSIKCRLMIKIHSTTPTLIFETNLTSLIISWLDNVMLQ
jgi:hypothetical protein